MILRVGHGSLRPAADAPPPVHVLLGVAVHLGESALEVTITGTEHLDTEMPVVMIANHQSFADILVLFRLRAHYKWVSKAENFRVPLIGWNMSLNRYIRIERGSIRGNLKMMRDCEVALRDGNSLMIFPEGTRSVDGRMRPFKEGAFELAIRMRRPILPIVITGTGEALPEAGHPAAGPALTCRSASSRRCCRSPTAARPPNSSPRSVRD